GPSGLLCFECQLAIAPDQLQRALPLVDRDGQLALKARRQRCARWATDQGGRAAPSSPLGVALLEGLPKADRMPEGSPAGTGSKCRFTGPGTGSLRYSG